MRAAYLLARLNAKPQHFAIEPSSYEKLSDMDVSHAMALLHHTGARALLRVKWAQQERAMPILLREMAAKALDEWERYRYSAPDPMRLTAVLRVAIQETVMPRICRACHGTGIRYQLELTGTDTKQSQQWVRQQCGACEGAGHRPYSERARARQAQMDRDTWRREWAEPYAEVLLPILDHWQRLGLRAVNRRLQR